MFRWFVERSDEFRLSFGPDRKGKTRFVDVLLKKSRQNIGYVYTVKAKMTFDLPCKIYKKPSSDKCKYKQYKR